MSGTRTDGYSWRIMAMTERQRVVKLLGERKDQEETAFDRLTPRQLLETIAETLEMDTTSVASVMFVASKAGWLAGCLDAWRAHAPSLDEETISEVCMRRMEREITRSADPSGGPGGTRGAE